MLKTNVRKLDPREEHALSASPIKRDIKISRGTHLMHFEEMRYALYRESISFLEAERMPSADHATKHAGNP